MLDTIIIVITYFFLNVSKNLLQTLYNTPFIQREQSISHNP